MELEFGVLGPLTVKRAQEPAPVRSATMRRLLALLLSRAAAPVSVSALIEGMSWDRTEATSRDALQVYVHRLRRLLGSGRVEHVPSGYVLRAEPDEVDSLRFAGLVERGLAAQAGHDPDLARDCLRAALALWRGEPYGDVSPIPYVVEEVQRLAEQRILAYEHCLALELELGRFDEAAVELAALTRAYPYREALRATLMLALHRAGRQAEALEVFRRTRALFVEELGIEPGNVLQRMHTAILRGDELLASPGEWLDVFVEPERVATDLAAALSITELVTAEPSEAEPSQVNPAEAGPGSTELVPTIEPGESAPPAPASAVPVRQLPSDVAGFAGRRAECKELDGLLIGEAATASKRSPAAVAVLVGTAGVGKTALAVHWAHGVRDRFPDGQLYVNLLGYAPGAPVTPAEALARILRGLGVPASAVPEDVEEAAAMYRSLLADRRVLVVLDNAGSADQVRPLLPAGPGCLVLVTSRDRLGGLVAREGARRVSLDVLSRGEAEALLANVIGPDRVAAEQAAAAELARLCVRLPLALRIAAAKLVDQPRQTIAGYVVQLQSDDRVSALQTDDDEQAAVRVAFDLSYSALPAAERRLFRLLGLAPGTDLTAAAAAALADTSVAEASRLLDRLAAAHLVQQHTPGRYASHDLLREYASTCALAEEAEPVRRAALRRLLSWYVATADRASRLLFPEQIDLLTLERTPEAPAPIEFADHQRALAWLEAERTNLVHAGTYAAEHGLESIAWLLADRLRMYFWWHGHSVEWSAIAEAGWAAAQAAGDVLVQAVTRLNLGAIIGDGDRSAQAVEHLSEAVRLARLAGSPDVEGEALGSLGNAYRKTGQPQEAVKCLISALDLHRRPGRQRAYNQGALGTLYAELGRLSDAVDYLSRAYATYVKIGARSGQAMALSNRGEANLMLGRTAQARDDLASSLAIHREVGNRYGAIDAMRCLAFVNCIEDRLVEALELARDAVALSRRPDTPHTSAYALATLGDILCAIGRHQEAAEICDQAYAEALAVARRSGHRHAEVQTLIGLAACRRLQGDLYGALELAQGGLRVALSVGYRLLEGQLREVLADVHLAQGETVLAASEAGRAVETYRECGYGLSVPGLVPATEVLTRAGRRSPYQAAVAVREGA